MNRISISLVIATYNRSAELMDTLGSVARQTFRPECWECIVVDNRSTDDTAARVAAFAREHPELNLRRICEQRQGLSFARNAGIEAAAGDLIAFVDDDELLNPEFLEAYTTLFDSRPEAVAAGGKVIADFETGRPRWMSPYTERPIANPMDYGDKVRQFPAGRIPAGGNMAFRREAFLRYGRFDPELGRRGESLIGGEESDLFDRMRRAGEVFHYVPGAVIRHRIPARKLTRDYFDRLCYNIGVSQRRRAELNDARWKLLCGEAAKWAATLLIAAWYAATLRPSKAMWIVRMRRQISRGVIG